jgi:hypothetical protein
LDELSRTELLLQSVDNLPTRKLTPWLRGQRERYHARFDIRRGQHAQVDRRFRRAETLFEEQGVVFTLAAVRLERGEWLSSQARREEALPLFADARESFQQLEAMPWLERLNALEAPPRAEVTA